MPLCITSKPTQALIAARLLLSALALVALIDLVAAASVGEFQVSVDDPNYWIKRKDWFHNRTKFELTDDNLRLYGSRRLMFKNNAAEPKGHLPFWFDYELFKKVFNKKPKTEVEDRARHEVYINTCLRVLKARTLFRMLAGFEDTLITSDADRFHYEIFGPVQSGETGSQKEADISFSVKSDIPKPSLSSEDPLDKAIRLVRHELDIVESRNQVETNLKAFEEVDGSAIKGKLPY